VIFEMGVGVRRLQLELKLNVRPQCGVAASELRW